ncbi:hypothetical protein NB311A_21101 [Nitrobacter sp. Nb-311A]|nr:hypothetical protein NB311A_21101 [Nitrobacter sp. Nb-311A]
MEVHGPQLQDAAGLLPRARPVAVRSRHSVARARKRYQVFMFAEEEHAEAFRKEFGGERMHPSEGSEGARWSAIVDVPTFASFKFCRKDWLSWAKRALL